MFDLSQDEHESVFERGGTEPFSFPKADIEGRLDMEI
jgi:hypothetical protein